MATEMLGSIALGAVSGRKYLAVKGFYQRVGVTFSLINVTSYHRSYIKELYRHIHA